MQQLCARGVVQSLLARSRMGLARSVSTAAAINPKEDLRKLDVDTHMLDNDTIKDMGLPKRPRGHHPGVVLHQRRSLRSIFDDPELRKELLTLSPLLLMVTTAFLLAGMTFYREIVLHPNVALNKKRRSQLFEIEEPERVLKDVEKYTDSPFRKLALHSPVAVVAHVQQEPPALPGDDKTLLGSKPAVLPSGLPQQAQHSVLGKP